MESQIKDDAATYDRLRASIVEGDFAYAGEKRESKTKGEEMVSNVKGRLPDRRGE